MKPNRLLSLALIFVVSTAGAVVAAPSMDSGISRSARETQAPALPLTASFDKVSDPDTGPTVLHLKNDSTSAIKASASVQVSVPSHGSQKDRKLEDHVIQPGEAWTITGLAAGDKVTVTADGFAPLELTVP